MKKACRNQNNRFRTQDFQLLESSYTAYKIIMCEMLFFFKFEFQKWTSSKTIIYDQAYLKKNQTEILEIKFISIEIKNWIES